MKTNRKTPETRTHEPEVTVERIWRDDEKFIVVTEFVSRETWYSEAEYHAALTPGAKLKFPDAG